MTVSLPSVCVIDASSLLDYYRHSTGADCFPESVTLVEWALETFNVVYAEFVVGHSRFADVLSKNHRLASKLRLLGQTQADEFVDNAPPNVDEAVSAAFDRVMVDSELMTFRVQHADRHVRPQQDDVAYVIRLSLIANALKAAVVLSKDRMEVAKAIGRCGLRNERRSASDATVITVVFSDAVHGRFRRPIVRIFRRATFGLLTGLKGGGMKGVAFAGALQELEPYFCFDTFVGASAGAIVAAMLACGYSGAELETVLGGLQLRQFVTLNPLSIVCNLLFRGGLFDATRLQDWVEEKLRQKTGLGRDVTFSDLTADLRITVSTKRRGTVVFSKRSHPQSSISYAVRCSASILFFFTPGNWEGDMAVDGGVQHNLPIRPYFEEGGDNRLVILSLNAARKRRTAIIIAPVLRIVGGLAAIWLKQDEDLLTSKYGSAVVQIDTGSIRATQLSVNPRECELLIESGRLAAVEFLERRGIR